MVAQLIRSFVTPRTGQEKPKDLKIRIVNTEKNNDN